MTQRTFHNEYAGPRRQIQSGLANAALIIACLLMNLAEISVVSAKSTIPSNAGSDTGAVGAQVAARVTSFTLDKELASLDFSPDGNHLALAEWVGSKVHIKSWRGTDASEKVFAITAGSALFSRQSGLTFSPDGLHLAIAHAPDKSDGYGVIRLWNVQSGEVSHEIKEPSRSGLRNCIEFASDGKLLYRSFDGRRTDSGDQFFVYDTNSWNLVWSLRTSPFIPVSMDISPNGKWAVLGGSVVENNQLTSRLVFVDLERHTVINQAGASPLSGEIKLVKWSPDSSRVVTVLINDPRVPPLPNIVTLEALSGKTLATESGAGDIDSVVFTPDGRYIIEAHATGPIVIWNSSHSSQLQEIPIQHSRLAISRDGHYLAIASLLSLSIWHFN